MVPSGTRWCAPAAARRRLGCERRRADRDRARAGSGGSVIGTSLAVSPPVAPTPRGGDQLARHQRRPEAEGLLHVGPAAEDAEARRPLQREAEQVLGEALRASCGRASATPMRKTTSLGSRLGGRGAAPAGVEADEVGAAVGEVGADAVPDHLRQALALGDDVGAGDQHRADGAIAVAVDHRDLQRRRRRRAARAADAHAVGAVLRLSCSEVKSARHVGRQVGARVADLVQQLLGDRAPVDQAAGAGVLGDDEARRPPAPRRSGSRRRASTGCAASR